MRHLEHNRYTLAAIDAIIGRGSQQERDDLLEAARQDPTLAGRIADLCRARLSRPDPEFFDRDLYEEFLETLLRLHRQHLAQMVLRLFDHWKLSAKEQAALLGLSPNNEAELALYRQGGPLADDENLLARVGHLLAIHESLRLIFPHNIDLAYRWASQPNRAFDNAPPLDTMTKGIEGLLVVRHYLGREREA